MRRVAAHRMTIGKDMFINHIAEMDESGLLLSHYPLSEELPATEWYNEFRVERLEVKES